MLSSADIPRFAIIAAMQPTHATSDMYWAEARVGPDRIRYAYAWRALLDGGARLALGSDFLVEEVNPMRAKVVWGSGIRRRMTQMPKK